MTTWERAKDECSVRRHLQSEATAALNHSREIAQKQIEALSADDHATFLELDNGLELAFGAKERSFGALQEHTKSHGRDAERS